MTNSLNNICNDILLNLRNYHASQSEGISRRQIASWVFQYSLLLAKKEIEDNPDYIDNSYTDVLSGMELAPIYGSDGIIKLSYMLETIDSLPNIMKLAGRSGILSVYDHAGNVIQSGDRLKAKFQKNRRYTCQDYIWYLYGDKIRVEGPDIIRFIDVTIVPDLSLDDPDDCDYWDKQLPLPTDKIPLLKQMIYEQELSISKNATTDVTNNAADDNVNKRAAQSASTKAPTR